MKSTKLINKKLSKENQKVSSKDPSQILAEFFNGLIIQIDEEYNHEP